MLFENYGQEVSVGGGVSRCLEVGGTNPLLVPNLKVGDQSPLSVRLLRQTRQY